jgi:hypothetical protein
MGDDNLTIIKKEDTELFSELILKNFSMESSHIKGESGNFFLQYRLLNNGKFTYPITRIASKMF